MISIVYLTNRKQPHFEWFLWSLKRELLATPTDVDLIRIDFYGPELPEVRTQEGVSYRICSPMPTPWQGKYREIDHDCFDASTARNTGACLAAGDYVVFVDDVSVLVNGWLKVVAESAKENRIVCGAYRKVSDLKVDTAGNISYWLPLPRNEGVDNRYNLSFDGPKECDGNWLFGCSFGIPLSAFMSVNGFDHSLSGLSFEDCTFGLRLVKAGYKLYYDRRMMTFESEEAHHNPEDIKFARHNRQIAFTGAFPGKDDCAWESLNWIAAQPPTARGTPNLMQIRETVSSGGSFPMHRGMFVWPDGKNLLGK